MNSRIFWRIPTYSLIFAEILLLAQHLKKGAAKGLNNLTDRHLSADVPNIIIAEPKGSMTQIILPYDFVIVHIMSFYVILINLNI